MCDNLLRFLFMFPNSSHDTPIAKYFVDRLIDLRNSFNFLNRFRLIFWILYTILSATIILITILRLVLFPIRRQWNCRYFLRTSVGSKDWPIRDLFSYSDILGSPTSSQLCAIVAPVSDRQGTIPLLSYIRRDFWFSSTTPFEWATLVDRFVSSRKEFQYRSTLKVKLVPRLSIIAWTIFQ